MKKILKIVGVIILLIILVALIHTLRNFIIVQKLNKNFAKYESSSNYNIKIHSVQEETTVDVDHYKKDNRQVTILKRYYKDEENKMSAYNNRDKIDIFWETNNYKTAQLDANAMIEIGLYNGLEADNSWQTLLSCICAKIRSTTYNEKECYYIDNFFSPKTMSGTDTNKLYIEKETGLCIKLIVDNQTSQKEYNFENVDDTVFEEPDITQYTLQENK